MCLTHHSNRNCKELHVNICFILHYEISQFIRVFFWKQLKNNSLLVSDWSKKENWEAIVHKNFLQMCVRFTFCVYCSFWTLNAYLIVFFFNRSIHCFVLPSLSACFFCNDLDDTADFKTSLMPSCLLFLFILLSPKMNVDMSIYCLLVLGRSHVKPAAKRRCMKNQFPS